MTQRLHLMLDTARPGMPAVMLFAAEGCRAMLVELSHEHRAS